MKKETSTKKVSKKQTKEKESINNIINLSQINAAISKKFGTVYNYCKQFNISQAEMSRFLNKKVPLTIRAVQKHCKNLDLKAEVIISKY